MKLLSAPIMNPCFESMPTLAARGRNRDFGSSRNTWAGGSWKLRMRFKAQRVVIRA